jgi:outer membrane protein assembly factor BamE (lipoprotein component of BamABCDE complex)
MSRVQVRSLLGSPDDISYHSNAVYYYYGTPPDVRAVAFPVNYDEGVVDWFIRN